MSNHTEAFAAVKAALTEGEYKVIDDISEITAVGHRVVQGGSLFNKSVLINDEVIAGIESLNDLAPLHNPANIMGINASIELFGKDVPQVAVFDNAFHSTMPAEAYTFPIPCELAKKYSIRRYGFHGTSHKFVSARCAEVMGKNIEDLKIGTCHLGNGSSITAVDAGKSVDTTMGFTPLDGLIMGTRCGNIDPEVVTYIQEKEGLSAAEMSKVMNKKSGLWIGFAPFSAHAGKTYPAPMREELVRLLAERFDEVFIHSGGGEEAAFSEAMESRYNNVTALWRRLPFKEERDLISHLDCVVTMDSLVMHLAALVATPTVSIWGATHPEFGFTGYGCPAFIY